MMSTTGRALEIRLESPLDHFGSLASSGSLCIGGSLFRLGFSRHLWLARNARFSLCLVARSTSMVLSVGTARSTTMVLSTLATRSTCPVLSQNLARSIISVLSDRSGSLFDFGSLRKRLTRCVPVLSPALARSIMSRFSSPALARSLGTVLSYRSARSSTSVLSNRPRSLIPSGSLRQVGLALT
jgi:hypothetical protein